MFGRHTEGGLSPNEEKARFAKILKAAETGDAEAQAEASLMYMEGKGIPQDYEEAIRWMCKAEANGCFTARIYLAADCLSDELDAFRIFMPALKFLPGLAEQGDPDAQYWHGFRTFVCANRPDGGCTEDRDKALYWIRKAAEGGCTQAQAFLGSLYARGKHVPRDYEEAMRWFLKAAEQSNDDARFNIGLMYLVGDGVTQDATTAMSWFDRVSKRQRHKCYWFHMGDLYSEGARLPQNDEKAMYWYTRAAEDGDDNAQLKLGLMYAEGARVPQNAEMAIKWFRKAAKQGEGIAFCHIGAMYENGIGVPQSYSKALKYYGKADWHPKAMSQMGYLYATGLGVRRNYKRALRWYCAPKIAPEIEVQRDRYELSEFCAASFYLNGLGVAQNDKEAFRWYRQAAEKGFALAQFCVGSMYFSGRGVSQDYEEALSWYRKAAEQDLALAKLHIGYIYYMGLGVPEDKAEATKWFRSAIEGKKDLQKPAAILAPSQGIPDVCLNALRVLNRFSFSDIPELANEIDDEFWMTEYLKMEQIHSIHWADEYWACHSMLEMPSEGPFD